MLKNMVLILALVPGVHLQADSVPEPLSQPAQTLASPTAVPEPVDADAYPPPRRRRRRPKVRPADYVLPVGLKVFGSPLGLLSPDFSAELGLEIELRRGVALSFAPQYFSMTTPLQPRQQEIYQGTSYSDYRYEEHTGGDRLPMNALGLELRYRFSKPEVRSGFFMGTVGGLGQVVLPIKSHYVSYLNGFYEVTNNDTETDNYFLAAAELGYQQQLFGWLSLSGGVRALWAFGIPDYQLFANTPAPPDDFQRVTGFVQAGLFAF
jgi:hypothetical protein